MAKRERNPERDRLIKELIAEYQPKSLLELQDVLKNIFAPLMEYMLKGERTKTDIRYLYRRRL